MAAGLLMNNDTMTLAERAEYRQQLEAYLEDFTLCSDLSLSAFKAYVDSDYTVLPFSGGWLEQPVWIRKDFELLRHLLDYWYDNLQRPRPDKPL